MSSKTAALVIDVQTGLVSGSFNEESILIAINDTISKVRASGGVIVYIQHCHSSYEPLMKGNPGWEIHPALEARSSDVYIEKTASDSFFESDLQTTLEQLGISELIVMGLQTEFCVDTTCRSALSKGYSVTLIADAHTTGNGIIDAAKIIEHHNTILGYLAHPHQQIQVVPSARFKPVQNDA